MRPMAAIKLCRVLRARRNSKTKSNMKCGRSSGK